MKKNLKEQRKKLKAAKRKFLQKGMVIQDTILRKSKLQRRIRREFSRENIARKSSNTIRIS